MAILVVALTAGITAAGTAHATTGTRRNIYPGPVKDIQDFRSHIPPVCEGPCMDGRGLQGSHQRARAEIVLRVIQRWFAV